jgi:hypothetical protein
MILKIAIALALGSIGLLLIQRAAERDGAAQIQERVEAQLRDLREHLFRR